VSLTPPEDFVYQNDGTIDIMRPGSYTVFWYVVCMTSQSTVGQSYQLKKLNYSLITPDWATVAGSANHIKVAQTPGFAIINISEDEIAQYGKATIALFNTADAEAGLTFFVPKAGIMIFGVSIESMEAKLAAIDTQIADIVQEIYELEQLVYLSEEVSIWSQTSELAGVGVSVINSGFTYNFWGIGALSSQQTLSAQTVYYLITSGQYEPLTYYEGDSAIGTLWIATPSGSSYSLPIFFDSTGIYITPGITYQDLPAGTVLRFTQALILVE